MPQPRTTQVSGSSADQHRQAGLLGEQAVEVAQQRAAAGQHHAALGDVGAELGRRLLERVLDARDDLVERVGERLQDSFDEIVKVRGTPSERLRPLTSISLTSEPGKAEPMLFLIISAVGSPISMP